jgi:hypothetical protein
MILLLGANGDLLARWRAEYTLRTVALKAGAAGLGQRR